MFQITLNFVTFPSVLDKDFSENHENVLFQNDSECFTRGSSSLYAYISRVNVFF